MREPRAGGGINLIVHWRHPDPCYLIWWLCRTGTQSGSPNPCPLSKLAGSQWELAILLFSLEIHEKTTCRHFGARGTEPPGCLHVSVWGAWGTPTPPSPPPPNTWSWCSRSSLSAGFVPLVRKVRKAHTPSNNTPQPTHFRPLITSTLIVTFTSSSPLVPPPWTPGHFFYPFLDWVLRQEA